jgi:hypothetical protein
VKITPMRAALALGVALSVSPALADEGMWTYDNPPSKQLKEQYGFEPTKAWLDALRLASVRFMDGGSGSFVSPDGLMITNHHVGLGCVQNVSSKDKDYVRNGFYAATRDEEVACPGYEVNVLQSFEDVTTKVQASVKADLSDQAAREARKAAISAIEKECNTSSGLRCDVVTLYQGGEYQLYRYKKFTDVRLVFAPEQEIAFFGGDPDNFTYPRHDLDICLMRAYDNGKPAKPTAFLPWTRSGAAVGELLFVSGHPGSTSRMDTVAELTTTRDVTLPLSLEILKGRIAMLRAYSAKGTENERRARTQIFGLENGVKANEGRLAALLDSKAFARKVEEEKALRAKVTADAKLSTSAGGAWDTIEAAQKKAASRILESALVSFSGSRQLGLAGQIVRLVVEIKKPNAERLEEYADAGLDSLRNRLFSTAPIYADMEEASLTHQLELAVAKLGAAHPFVKTVLEGKTPAEVAKAAVAGTKLADPAVRKALVEGGEKAVQASSDTMILLARKIDPLARTIRKQMEDEVEAPTTRAGEKIALARFQAYGKAVPPDATFTLRLSYGTVKAFPAEGTLIAPFTTFHGLLDRSLGHGGKAPWTLPSRWTEKKESFDLATPLNFASTHDIIGGNSGSPVVNRAGEFVGIIFDSNIHGLAGDFYYTDEKARSVSVDARGILEALRNVFGATALVDELTKR